MKNFHDFLEHLLKQFPADLGNDFPSDELELIKHLFAKQNLVKSIRKWVKELPNRSRDSLIPPKQSYSALRRAETDLQRFQLANSAIVSGSDVDGLGRIFFERGKLLWKASRFQEALDDFMVASRSKRDVATVYRIALCALRLEDAERFRTSFSDLTSFFEGDEGFVASEKELEKVRPEYEKLKQKAADLTTKKPKNEAGDYVCFRKPVVVEKSEAKGRFVVSSEEILENEEILTESAFAFVPLNPDGFYFDCSHCAATNVVPYPCPSCKMVYCSLKCQEKDLKLHKFVCPGIQRNFLPDIGLAFLALQTFLVGFHHSCPEIWEEAAPETAYQKLLDSQLQEPKPGGVSEQYRLVLSLETHLEKVSGEDRLSYALTALIVAAYLEEYSTLVTSQLKTQLFGAVILRHLAQMITNAHTITDLRFVENGKPLLGVFMPSDRSRVRIFSSPVFSAIFPYVSLLNHSCEPNIRNRFEGSKLTISATSRIPPKAEVFNNYGLNRHLVARPERQAVLRDQYHFDCDCRACESDEETETKRLRCPKCGSFFKSWFDLDAMEVRGGVKEVCECGTTLNSDDFLELVNRTVTSIDQESDLPAALVDFRTCVTFLHEKHAFLYFYSRKLVDWMRSCGARDPEVAKIALESTKEVFGEQSLEYQLELLEDFSRLQNLTSTRSFKVLTALCNDLNQ